MEMEFCDTSAQNTDMTTEKMECLFRRLHLHDKHQKLKAEDFLQLNAHSCVIQPNESCAEKDLVHKFLHQLLMMDYRARSKTIEETTGQSYTYPSITNVTEEEADVFDDIFSDLYLSIEETIKLDEVHPMDVQMAVFHFADSFLKQLMVTKLSQCQYALPLLVPNPFTQQIEFPLWTFRQINKSWMTKNTNNENITKTLPVYKAKTPMVAFFRFDPVSSSKSELMSRLINEKQKTFFHRNCKGSSKTKLLMDGVVEIAWYCPSGKNSDKFTDCVAFCNLHGDARANEKQLNILTKMASVGVVILPQLDRNDNILTKIQNIDSMPLIFLLTEKNSKFTWTQQGRLKIGLKDRNQAEVTDELVKAINSILSSSSALFKLEDVASIPDFQNLRVDENDNENCKRAKEAAEQMISLLKNKNLAEIKEIILPFQGKSWHLWCQKNKQLHRPQKNETEMEISKKRAHLKKIRKQQQESDCSEFMKLFLKQFSFNADERIFFLKWLGILLDECTSENLHALRLKYSMKWAKIIKLKDNSDKPEQLAAEQKEFKAISENLISANFGLEHILREVGQIYESCSSVEKNKEGLQCHFSSLPSLAAEMMISGFPLELMDGDAAHVPVIWVTAVLDEVIKKLGDLNIFVLSVLGIQSSGKSTMLNAMFGLQFAVSAGRCTRGAFMQLVKVSEDMKPHLKFDYILVVDTEGLCSIELSGRETRHHDNELATFVVGVANMTLINISGENPTVLQEILQIVVQAFLRMKNVKLNPSCMFVHQNVGITTKEKCIQGRMRLQEELDEMAELAAKGEDCDIHHFNDVIKFDAENDVKYFAPLWEGTPPMAPPNPDYSESVQDLKKAIVSKASQCVGMRMTHFKYRIQSLWEALLNEHFVFSFRDCLEIAVYRKLETKYSEWTWNLRYAMLEIENNLLNKIENEKINEVLEHKLQEELKTGSDAVNKSMTEYFEKDEDASILIQWKASFIIKINEVQENIVRDTKKKLNGVIQQRKIKKTVDAQKTHHENKLLEKSKESALKVKVDANNEDTLKEQFDSFWKEWLDEIKKEMPSIKKINVFEDMKQILGDIHESVPIDHFSSECIDISTVASYADYIVFKSPRRKFDTFFGRSLDEKTENNVRALVTNIANDIYDMINSLPIAKMGYNIAYVQQITDYIKRKVKEHEDGPVNYVFKKKFTMNLTLHVCKTANKIFIDLHRIFKEANDPVLYFEKKRGEYYNIFKKYCHGAKSTAIFGELICNKLKEPIQENAYKTTAREIAGEMKTNCESFNGNRSKLEKHILEMLAKNEDFNMYITYIHNPKEHFKSFIRNEVSKYISEKFSVSILPKIKKHIEILQQKIIDAAHEASEVVNKKSGDTDLWLYHFTQQLSGLLVFSEKTFIGVSHDDVDISLLEDVVRTELPSVKFDTNRTFRIVNFIGKLDYKDRPDEILIKQFCHCCWVQCPFCKAICTNTIENHSGDHSVPFHRNIGLNGWHYRGTTNLSVSICTSEVAKEKSFYPYASADTAILWREYRKGGPEYANWSITPDFSELPYWKWFVCRFQKDLETKYNKTFQGAGKIPNEWMHYTKQNAIESLRYLS